MKTLISLLFAAAYLPAQIVYPNGATQTGYSIPIQLSATDSVVNSPVSYNWAIAIPNWFFSQVAFPTVTLTGNLATGTTVIPLSSAANLATGMGLCILSLPSNTTPAPTTCPLVVNANGCSSTSCLGVSGGEIARVVSVSGNNVTVTRATVGVAGTYTTGQFVTPMLYGSYSDYGAALFSASPPPTPAQIVQNPVWKAPDAVGLTSAVGTASSSIKALK